MVEPMPPSNDPPPPLWAGAGGGAWLTALHENSIKQVLLKKLSRVQGKSDENTIKRVHVPKSLKRLAET